MGCGASAGAAVRGGSGPGPGPGAGRPGDDGSAGRASGPVGGAWSCWGTGPPCVVAGRSSVPDVAEAWGVRPPMGPWVWGCPASEGRAAVALVGVAVCVRVGRLSVVVYVGSAAGRSGVPWCGRGSGWACVVAGWLAAGRGPCAGATGGVRGCGLPVGLGAGTLCGCGVPGGCPGRPPPYSWGRVGLRSWQVMLGVPGSLWPRGVVLVVVAPPVWTHALVGGSVVCWP